MKNQDLNKLIELERKKIKKHLQIGFNLGMYYDYTLKELSKNGDVIDRSTKEPITKEKIFNLKSILFGINPKHFKKLFPNEDNENLYKYIKSYVKYCQDEEDYDGFSI